MLYSGELIHLDKNFMSLNDLNNIIDKKYNIKLTEEELQTIYDER